MHCSFMPQESCTQPAADLGGGIRSHDTHKSCMHPNCLDACEVENMHCLIASVPAVPDEAGYTCQPAAAICVQARWTAKLTKLPMLSRYTACCPYQRSLMSPVAWCTIPAGNNFASPPKGMKLHAKTVGTGAEKSNAKPFTGSHISC